MKKKNGIEFLFFISFLKGEREREGGVIPFIFLAPKPHVRCSGVKSGMQVYQWIV